jgi:Flp pilus assembly pilin Flp
VPRMPGAGRASGGTTMLERFWRDESGPTAVEYAVLAAAVAAVVVLAATALGLSVRTLFLDAGARYPR